MNLLSEPTEPFTLFNYSDIAILILFNIVIYFLLKKTTIIDNKLKVIFMILFLIVFPLVSIKIEINNVHKKFEVVDSFNLLYTYLKIPIWWVIGILNYYILKK